MADVIAHMPPLEPTVALIAGILILITPRMFRVALAFYLILVGAKGLGVLG